MIVISRRLIKGVPQNGISFQHLPSRPRLMQQNIPQPTTFILQPNQPIRGDTCRTISKYLQDQFESQLISKMQKKRLKKRRKKPAATKRQTRKLYKLKALRIFFFLLDQFLYMIVNNTFGSGRTIFFFHGRMEINCICSGLA